MDKQNYSILTIGVNDRRTFLVSIETIIQRGLFQFEIIGLANKTISESKQRILSAIDYCLPDKKQYIHKKIVTLLSPAGIKKEGSHFDLPIAVSYITSEKRYLIDLFEKVVILGELTLTGSVLYVRQIHTFIEEGVKNGIQYFIVPNDNAIEIIRKDIYIWKVNNISEIIEALKLYKNSAVLKQHLFKKNSQIKTQEEQKNVQKPDITDKNPERDVKDNYLVDSIQNAHLLKRALSICIAGRHSLLLIGEPGSGKSLISKSAKELQPKIEISNLNPVQIDKLIEEAPVKNKNLLFKNKIEAPFREPHHTLSYSEMLGNKNFPGEIVLANKGILFLDEISEINKRALEGLRQPLEDSYIQSNQREIIETDFILIGAMNPCDCGFYTSTIKKCICARNQIDKFQRKVSSPLFQRFDITIDTSSKNNNYLYQNKRLQGATILKDILRVRKKQTERHKILMKEDASKPPIDTLKTDAIRDIKLSRYDRLSLDVYNENTIDKEVQRLLYDISKRFNLSKRETYSILRVARTIADIEESDEIKSIHIHEASALKIRKT